jgi:hypothetical protein
MAVLLRPMLLRFWVPRALLFDFLKRCVEREAALAMTDGFLGLQVRRQSRGRLLLSYVAAT